LGAGAISSISVDPRDSSMVIVGVLGQEFRDSTIRGIYRTTDGGAHWVHALSVGPSTGVCDLIRLPGQPQTLLAGLWEYRRTPWHMTSGGPSGGLYRSDDNGVTWHKLSGAGLPSSPTGRIGLSASGTYVYARIQSKEGFIWRSTDRGQHWQRMPDSQFVGGRGFYFSRVFADPANPRKVINLEGVASVSTDGAQSFSQTALTGGWDFHHIWWSSDGRRVILGSDEGLLLSTDGGANWVQPYVLPFSQVYHVGLDGILPYYHLCVGLQDNDSWCAPSSVPNLLGVLNRDWITVAPGDGMWSVFDPLDQNILWSTETNTSSGQLFITDFRTQQQAEVSPSAHLAFGAAASTFAYRFNWDTPVAFTAGQSPLGLVGGNVLFASADRGQTWKVISPDLTRDDKSKQAVSGGPIQGDMSDAEVYDTIMYVATTPLDPGMIWIGTDDGLVQLSRDSGAHWQNVTPKEMPPWARVMGMEPGHYHAGTAYAVADGHMNGDDGPHAFVTDDYGASWRSISGDLPSNLFLRSIREDAKNPNLLYAGTQRGVWVSLDRGAHWHDLRLNMPASAVYDMEIQPDRNDLVVGTHGRGVWILDDVSPLQQLESVQGQASALLAPRPAYRMFAVSPINTSIYSAVTSVPDNIFVGRNAPTGAIFNYYLRNATQPAPTITILDASDRTVRVLSGSQMSNRAGMNRVYWNLTETGPTPWNASISKQIEPQDGAEVLPGTYTAVLRAAGLESRQTVSVLKDPRDPATQAQYQQRHDTLAELYRELDGIDVMLNAIDAKGSPAAYASVKAQLTNVPRFDEDNIGRPPGLRERVLDLISQFSTSYQAPSAPQLAEAAALKQQYGAISAAYSRIGS
jgi:photosystem II stability/assembly factor-like uncharacterized protein